MGICKNQQLLLTFVSAHKRRQAICRLLLERKKFRYCYINTVGINAFKILANSEGVACLL